MAKQSGGMPKIDEDFMKELISQGVPSKQDNNKTNDVPQETQTETVQVEKPTPRKRKGGSGDYRETYFQKVELADRQPLYVSRTTHEKLMRIVTVIGGRKVTVSSYVENILLRHFERKYSINSLVYWVTYVHNVVYSFYRSMIYCYINSTQRCAGSIVIDIIPTNGADKRKFFPFAPYFPVTNVIKRYFYPYFPAIIGIKGYSFPYFPYLSGIMKIKTALYSLFSRLDWHKTVVFPCLGEIYEGIRSLSWEIPVT